MSVLLLAEHDGTTLNIATAKALTAVLELGLPVDILVCGTQVHTICQTAAQLQGVRSILVADDKMYAHALAESTAALILTQRGNYSHFAAAATSKGKNTMPRVAALLDVMQISDVSAIIDSMTFERPIYAGNAIEVVQSRDTYIVLTIRTANFDSAPHGGTGSITPIAAAAACTGTEFVSQEHIKAERPDLANAQVVISGGRALGSAEAFQSVLNPLADELNAAIGASRAAVDAGFAPNDAQVGQTGKIIAPQLYIAVGISGAIQHTAGMKDSKVVVAINKDPNAPIFQVADYGIVGDLFEIVPQLVKELKYRNYI